MRLVYVGNLCGAVSLIGLVTLLYASFHNPPIVLGNTVLYVSLLVSILLAVAGVAFASRWWLVLVLVWLCFVGLTGSVAF
jgi:hypothetical protein